MSEPDVSFKAYLGIPDVSWNGIGRHLGHIIDQTLKEKGLTTGHVCGKVPVPEDYLEEYIQGNTYGASSIGCFGPPIMFGYLGVAADRIFSLGSPQEKRDACALLCSYLTALSTESMTGFLQHPPGAPLRNHILKRFNKAAEKYDVCPWDTYAHRWKYMLRDGTFFTSEEMNDFSLMFTIQVNKLVPVREQTRAERFEIHERWQGGGGFGIPGPTMDEVLRRSGADGPEDYWKLPQGTPRTQHYNESYVDEINTNLSISMPLWLEAHKLMNVDRPAVLNAIQQAEEAERQRFNASEGEYTKLRKEVQDILGKESP